MIGTNPVLALGAPILAHIGVPATRARFVSWASRRSALFAEPPMSKGWILLPLLTLQQTPVRPVAKSGWRTAHHCTAALNRDPCPRHRLLR